MAIREIILKVTVLTDEEDYQPESLGDVAEYIMDGGGTGIFEEISDTELTPVQAIDAVHAVGSDPSFFRELEEFEGHHNFRNGQLVYFTDPDNGISSGVYLIVNDDHPEVISMINFAGNECEAHEHELQLISLEDLNTALRQEDGLGLHHLGLARSRIAEEYSQDFWNAGLTKQTNSVLEYFTNQNKIPKFVDAISEELRKIKENQTP
jgi:hypothetical protein